MKCFVTGASGFIGANLVRELCAKGHEVVVCVRKGSNLSTLAGCTVQTVECDLLDMPGLASAMEGCDWCFHVAASYHLWLPEYKSMYRTNVDGTRMVLQAAGMAGCTRIVYTSTVGCIALPSTKNDPVKPTDESAPVGALQMTNHYKMSKWRAEEIARNLAGKGLPVVIVNPSAPIGPRDAKPTPTGQVIVDFLNRRLPAYLDTGLNWVHVNDVVAGHILAAEKGHIGERYILGNAQGNWTMKQALGTLSEITGIPAPKMQVPYGLALGAAHVSEWWASMSNKPPKAPLAGVRMAKYKMWFNPRKAIQELGLPQTDPRRGFEDAVAWFRSNGFAH